MTPLQEIRQEIIKMNKRIDTFMTVKSVLIEVQISLSAEMIFI